MCSLSRSVGLEAGDGSVLVLPDEEDVEHADDSAINEIDEYRNSVAGHRCVRGIRDHHDVDGAKFVFVRFHPCLHSSVWHSGRSSSS